MKHIQVFRNYTKVCGLVVCFAGTIVLTILKGSSLAGSAQMRVASHELNRNARFAAAVARVGRLHLLDHFSSHV